MSLASTASRTREQSMRGRVSPEEWHARIDLAAAYRYAELKDWTNHIYNHFTLRVPSEPFHFLIKPHDITFGEVTASSLMKLDMDGKPVNLDQNVNAAGFTIHTAVLGARPEINAVCHLHSRPGSAIAAHKRGLRCLTQESMLFYNRVGYHNFEGVADEEGERERLARDLGPHKAMILRNHGLLTCGTTIQDAIFRLSELIAAADVQLRLEASGAEVNEVPPEVCEKAAQQFERYYAKDQWQPEWQALLRKIERADPAFRE